MLIQQHEQPQIFFWNKHTNQYINRFKLHHITSKYTIQVNLAQLNNRFKYHHVVALNIFLLNSEMFTNHSLFWICSGTLYYEMDMNMSLLCADTVLGS